MDRCASGEPAAHRRVVVERADYELCRGGRTVDRHLRPVSHQQGQRPAVVQVRVRYNGRVEAIKPADVGRYGAASVRIDPRVNQNPRLAEVEEVAAATHLTSPSQGAEGQRWPWLGIAADPWERGATRRLIYLSPPARWRRVLVVGVFLRGPAALFPGVVQVGVRLEHLAHELHQASGLRGAFQRSWQGRDLVLYSPHQELSEASVGKAGILQGVPYPVTLLDHAPKLLVQLLDALGRPGVGRALAFERLLELGAAPFEFLDALVELAPQIQRRGCPLLRLSDQLGGVRAFARKDLDLFGEGSGPLFGGPGSEREPLVVLLQALQFGFEIPDTRILGGPFLGLASLLAPGVHERPDDAIFGLHFRAEGGQQQALGGVDLLEFLQVLRGETFQGFEGLGWDLLLDGCAERPPSSRVMGDPARDAPKEGRATS